MYIVGTYYVLYNDQSCLETYFWCILSVQNIPKIYLKFVSYSKQSDSWAVLCTACVNSRLCPFLPPLRRIS